jgi:uncharacterized protein YegJ (DUF2314 family)
VRQFPTIAAALAVLTTTFAAAETLLERAKRDALAFVEKDDAEMAAAMQRARETLPGFLELARSPRPKTSSFAVKVAVVENDDVEYFWIAPFQQDKDGFTGEINNTPQLVKKVKLGQKITFQENEIVDWLYADGGRMIGNFTACVLLKREPKEEAEELIKQFGLRCDP